MPQSTFDLTRLIRCACILEVTARKPGNVHPEAAFPDLCHDDFVNAARVVSPILAKSRERGVGRTILDGVCATRETTGSNANLGILLLIAPPTVMQSRCNMRANFNSFLKPVFQFSSAKQTFERIGNRR